MKHHLMQIHKMPQSREFLIATYKKVYTEHEALDAHLRSVRREIEELVKTNERQDIYIYIYVSKQIKIIHKNTPAAQKKL